MAARPSSPNALNGTMNGCNGSALADAGIEALPDLAGQLPAEQYRVAAAQPADAGPQDHVGMLARDRRGKLGGGGDLDVIEVGPADHLVRQPASPAEPVAVDEDRLAPQSSDQHRTECGDHDRPGDPERHSGTRRESSPAPRRRSRRSRRVRPGRPSGTGCARGTRPRPDRTGRRGTTWRRAHLRHCGQPMELILRVRPLDGEPDDLVVDVEASHTVNDLARRARPAARTRAATSSLTRRRIRRSPHRSRCSAPGRCSNRRPRSATWASCPATNSSSARRARCGRSARSRRRRSPSMRWPVPMPGRATS